MDIMDYPLLEIIIGVFLGLVAFIITVNVSPWIFTKVRNFLDRWLT